MRYRLAAESAQEREARLQQMSHRQLQRLTFDEREVQLQHARGRESEGSRHQSSQLFNQHSVQMKMRKFHTDLTSLSSPKRSTCLESFPGL